jgi:pimeloyl-ACP methyl ester carboxylesterase
MEGSLTGSDCGIAILDRRSVAQARSSWSFSAASTMIALGGSSMAVIALVHGAWGVPEEWKGVVESLRALGHVGLPVDLPITDRHAGLAEHAEAVVRAVAHVREPVAVVAHSASGYVAPLVALRRPVAHLVYLTALVPRPGIPYAQPAPSGALQEATGDAALVGKAFRALIVDRQDGTCMIDPRGLALLMGASEEDADAMVPLLADLMRPHALRPFGEPWPGDALPAVPSSYLLCSADEVLPPDAQRAMAARLGVAPVDLGRVDHGAHVKRPRIVAEAIARVLSR